MGHLPSDDDFYAIILGSLPPSYDPYISAVSATSSVTGTTLSADDLMLTITEEYEHRNLKAKTVRRTKMSPSTPTTQGRVGREVRVRRKTKMLNVSIVIKRGIRNQIVGRREVERKDKVKIRREKEKLKKRKKKRRRPQLRRKRMRKRLTRSRKLGWLN